MKLRRATRYKRRLPVRFWNPDDRSQHEGFTVDISLSGMFIATRAVLPAHTRFRLEVLEPTHNHVFQAEVMRAGRVALELQRIQPSGMGVRLLSVEELIREMLPPEQRGALPPPVGAQAAPWSPEKPAPGHYAIGTRDEPVAEAKPVYLVRFSSPEVFLEVFRRHHEEGVFFVPTSKPAPVGNEIGVTFELLHSDLPPLQVEGTVQSHLMSDQQEDPAPSGMRVAFVDPESALEQLRIIIRGLRDGG